MLAHMLILRCILASSKWSECLCSPTPNSYVGILTFKDDGIRRCGLGDFEKLLRNERDLMNGVSAS